MSALYRDLHPRLARYVRASEPRAADDLLGEVWLAIARGLNGFAGDERSFRAWAFSIARRRIADHRRRGIRRNTHPADPVTFVEAPAPDDAEASALSRLSGQDAADLVTSLLPADQAEVVLLRVLADLDVDEVAEMLGRTSNWVRVTQHRALRRLAERVDESSL